MTDQLSRSEGVPDGIRRLGIANEVETVGIVVEAIARAKKHAVVAIDSAMMLPLGITVVPAWQDLRQRL